MDQDSVAISDARANMSDLLAKVRLLRRCILLTQRGKVRAAIVPADLGEAIQQAGGPDKALEALRGQQAGARPVKHASPA